MAASKRKSTDDSLTPAAKRPRANGPRCRTSQSDERSDPDEEEVDGDVGGSSDGTGEVIVVDDDEEEMQQGGEVRELWRISSDEVCQAQKLNPL